MSCPVACGSDWERDMATLPTVAEEMNPRTLLKHLQPSGVRPMLSDLFLAMLLGWQQHWKFY